MCEAEQSKYIFCKLNLAKWKRVENPLVADENNKVYYTVMGYYDSLCIESCKSWYELRPGKNTNYARNEYTLRLIRKKTNSKSDCDFMRNDLPIVACCLVHLSDNYVKNNNFLSLAPFSCLDMTEENFTASVWCDIGFFDVAVIMHSNSISKIEETLKNIIRTKSDAVSSLYTIVGYSEETKFFTDTEKHFADESVNAEIDVALRENADLLSKGIGDPFLQIIGGGDKQGIKATFGCDDLRIQVEKNLSDFIRWHKREFGLHDQMRFSKTHILWGLNEVSSFEKLPTQTIKNRKDLDSKVFNAYSQFTENYNHMLEAHNTHRRVAESVENVVSLYYQVISTTHSLDVKTVCGRFLQGFFNTASTIMDYMENNKTTNKKETYDSAGQAYTYISYPRLIENAVAAFREAMGALLFDIWRSDSAYFEGQTSEHPTVGSAAKLLFAYNQVLYDWDNAYNEDKKSGDDSESTNEDTGFTYLVTSGGKDITVNIDLFNYNHKILLEYSVNTKGEIVYGKNGEKICRPIIVTVPEGSLYDLKGSLLRMAHEFFHKRGDRCRSIRAKKFYDFICNIAADEMVYLMRSKFALSFAKHIFNNRVYRNTDERHNPAEEKYSYNNMLDAWRDQLVKAKENGKSTEREKRGIEKQEIKEFEQEIYQLFSFEFAQLKTDVKKVLTEGDLKGVIGDEKESFYGRNIYKKLIDIFESRLSDENRKNKILEHIQTFLREMSTRCCVAFEKEESKSFFINYLCTLKDDTKYCEQTFWELWIRFIEGNDKNDTAFIELTGIPNYKKDFPDQYDFFKNMLGEFYADSMALTALYNNRPNTTDKDSYKFLEYVLTFLFEQRDYKYLFRQYNSAFIDEKEPLIEFGGLFIHISVAIKQFWENAPQTFTGEKKEIIDCIKKYYTDVMYNGNDEKAKGYAEGLYQILERIMKSYTFYFGDDDYLQDLLDYLKDCRGELKKGKNLIELMGKDLALTEEFPDFILKRWKKIYTNQ